MTTVGEMLKRRRTERKLSLADVEKSTKIRKKFLEALEEGQYNLLPPQTFIRGFIKNYAVFLGLPPEEMLAFYRREVNVEKQPVLPTATVPLPPKLTFTPRLLMVIGVGALLILFFAYLLGQYLMFTGAPYLTVDQPKDYSVVTESPVEVSGKTDPSSTLNINDQQVSLDESGNFQVKIPVNAGLNVFTIVSENKFKKEAKVIRHVRLEQ